MKPKLIEMFVCVVVCSCGLKHVPSALLEKLPYEAKIELLEAENDLAVAVDRLDEARAEIVRAKEQLKRAKDRENDAEREVGAASDPTSKDVAKLAVAEADTRVEWLRAKQKLNLGEESIAEQNLQCAIAHYELARLKAARKAKIEGSERLSEETFTNQAKECDDKTAAQKVKQQQDVASAEKVRETWEAARLALAQRTFDARASSFVE